MTRSEPDQVTLPGVDLGESMSDEDRERLRLKRDRAIATLVISRGMSIQQAADKLDETMDAVHRTVRESLARGRRRP